MQVMQVFFLLFLLGLLFALMLSIDYALGSKLAKKQALLQPYPDRFGEILLLPTGDEFFKTYFQDIEDAKKTIFILFYIVKNDNVSQSFLDLLVKKAQQGVEVRLLLDRVGGWSLPRHEIKRLTTNGVHFQYSHRPHLPYIFYTLNKRNHRKITIIDGTAGYLGGYNVGREYLGLDPKLGCWRDFHIKIIGDGAQDLTKQFLLDWDKAANTELTTDTRYFPPLHQGTKKLSFVPTAGNELEQAFCHLINSAKQEIFIGTPYFIPSKALFNTLLEAAKKGITINIMVPLKPDHPFVKEAAYPYFMKLLEAGCTIYRYYEGFYHTKVLLIDNRICDVGTANFDKRSLFINEEMNCFISDPSFIQSIRMEIDKDIKRSEKLTKEKLANLSLFEKVRTRAAALISDLL